MRRIFLLNPTTVRFLTAPLLIFLVFLVWSHRDVTQKSPLTGSTDPRPWNPSSSDDILPCDGIAQSSRPDFGEAADQNSTPQPYAGSFSDLNLIERWTTAEARFGPYRWPSESTDARLDGITSERVDWATLQQACILKNRNVFDVTEDNLKRGLRFRSPTWKDTYWAYWLFNKSPARSKKIMGSRIALVLRAWAGYRFEDDDIWHIRAIITEASLETGGEYEVFMLMDVKDHAMETDEQYEALLDNLVPQELRNITILFNTKLLQRWYPKTREHRPNYQIGQALQLFAQLYPGFEHYWQLEMDVRFSGHVGQLLKAVTSFADKEPRKQARQRASYAYLPSMYSSYEEFRDAVNEVLQHDDPYYTGIRISDILHPIGPRPPSLNPREDDFSWGVGEPADFITFSQVNNVSIHKAWMYYDWTQHFKEGLSTPRVIAPVATQRISWNLLNAIHNAQLSYGLAIQSESTFISFALWHGMKISVPPLPIYSRDDHLHSPDEISRYVNGGLPSSEHHGMAEGEWVYDRDGEQYMQSNTTLHDDLEPTWRFISPYPQDLWNAWTKGLPGDMEKNKEELKNSLPTLVLREGKIYLPNTILHPIKTNPDP